VRFDDPRSLAVDLKADLLLINSGTDRVLAISSDGRVVRDTGRTEGLNPGGGVLGLDGRYFVGLRSARTIIAFSTSLDAALEHVLPPKVVPFPRGFAFGHAGGNCDLCGRRMLRSCVHSSCQNDWICRRIEEIPGGQNGSRYLTRLGRDESDCCILAIPKRDVNRIDIEIMTRRNPILRINCG
jgi:hypothetical protein